MFAGSGLGSRRVYQQAARDLGKELAQRRLGLVYGGASVGLMGEVADATLRAGGEVIGVVPRGLWFQEANHSALTVLYEVGTMHERKALMTELADGFIALPGGLGTFDELFETFAGERPGEVHKDNCQLWERIQHLLPDVRERRVAYLLFHCNLSPKEILRHAPQEFREVQEICHLRRHILERVLLHSNLMR